MSRKFNHRSVRLSVILITGRGGCRTRRRCAGDRILRREFARLPPIQNGRLADEEPGRPAWDTSRCVGQEQPIAIIACGVMEESEDTG